jgi:hypothetical protein
MGMYTEFHFNSQLIEDVPAEVVDVLKFMVGESEEEPTKLPKHELFDEGRCWRFMLRTGSYYFDADTISTIRYDKIARAYYLCIRCDLKNYGSEIENFIDWVMPYLDKYEGNFLGFYRYEENEEPTLVYYHAPVETLTSNNEIGGDK